MIDEYIFSKCEPAAKVTDKRSQNSDIIQFPAKSMTFAIDEENLLYVIAAVRYNPTHIEMMILWGN